MAVSATACLFILCSLFCASFAGATVDSSAAPQGVTITFPDEHVGSFHLSSLYPDGIAITADTPLDDIKSTLAAFVDDVVPSSVFLAYSNCSYTEQLPADALLGARTELFVGVAHPDLSLVDGLSERQERRLVRLVERIDAAIDRVVRRGQADLLEAADKAEQLVDDAGAQTALVQLLDARVYELIQRAHGDQSSAEAALRAAEDAVATASVAAYAQMRLTGGLQGEIAEVQALLRRILRDVAEVDAIVGQAQSGLGGHGRERGSHGGGGKAAEEQKELAEATLVVQALTEVLELGVKAVAQAYDILSGGEAGVVLEEALVEAVQAAQVAVDEAEGALRDVPADCEQSGAADQQTQATGVAVSSTASDACTQAATGSVDSEQSSTANQQAQAPAVAESSTGGNGGAQTATSLA